MFFTGKLEREVYAETIINKSFKIVDDLAKDVNEYLINDNGTVKESIHDVYFDELQERIDKKIEYINEYK